MTETVGEGDAEDEAGVGALAETVYIYIYTRNLLAALANL